MRQKIFLALAILGIIIVSGCVNQTSVKSVAPVNIDLRLSTPPKIGETATLSMTVISEKHATNATIDFILPDGIEAMSNTKVYEGELLANKQYSFEITIKPVKEGAYTLRGRVSNNIDYGAYKSEELKDELMGGNTARIPLSTTSTYAVEEFVPELLKNSTQTQINEK